LNLHDVSFLLSLLEHFLLGVDNNSDAVAVPLHPGNVIPNGELTKTILPSLGGVDEGTLLGTVPVLVETPTTFFTKMLSKDGPEASRTMRSFNVASNSNNHNRWTLKDSNTLQDFLLVGLGSLLV